MQLCELKRGTNFLLQEYPVQPPDILTEADQQKEYKLHNIDGMYSYCTDKYGHVYHFAAWTEVTRL